MALKNGTLPGVRYMGVNHYVSTLHAANHIFAGVMKVQSLGILRSTYGEVIITQDPNLQSGIGSIVRVDYGFAFWNNFDPITFDVNVA